MGNVFERKTAYTGLAKLVNSNSTKENNLYLALFGKVLSEFNFKEPKSAFYNKLEEIFKMYSTEDLTFNFSKQYFQLGNLAYIKIKNLNKFYSLKTFSSKRDVSKVRTKEYSQLQNLLEEQNSDTYDKE